MGNKKTRQDLLPGTLDMLILKSLTRGVMHGYGIVEHIRTMSDEVLKVEEGSLYPALQRLQLQGLIDSEWGHSVNNRRARYYRLTAAGRKQLGVGPMELRIGLIPTAIARVMKPVAARGDDDEVPRRNEERHVAHHAPPYCRFARRGRLDDQARRGDPRPSRGTCAAGDPWTADAASLMPNGKRAAQFGNVMPRFANAPAIRGAARPSRRFLQDVNTRNADAGEKPRTVCGRQSSPSRSVRSSTALVFLQLNDTFLRAPESAECGDAHVAVAGRWRPANGQNDLSGLRRLSRSGQPTISTWRCSPAAATEHSGGRRRTCGRQGAGAQPVSVVLAIGELFSRAAGARGARAHVRIPSEDLPPLGTPVAVVSDA